MKKLVYMLLSLCLILILFSTPIKAEAATSKTPAYGTYKYSDYVWKKLKKEGFSDAAAAAVLGNMMNECGGNTLKLKPYTKAKGYYGVCMWSKKYCLGVWGKNLSGQIDYLFKTMPKEFKTFGKKYKAGMTYIKFKKLTNPRKAALCFAKVYKRCSSGSYTKKKDNATKAYKYYTAIQKAQLAKKIYGKYTTADYIWKSLRQAGFSEAATAGILGNMMSECGGHTLTLQWGIYGPGHYGLCQWSARYVPQIQGADLKTQVDYLISSMDNSFTYFSGGPMTVTKFKKLTNPEDAALYFAKYYEVCGNAGYSKRQTNARTAYNYYKGAPI